MGDISAGSGISDGEEVSMSFGGLFAVGSGGIHATYAIQRSFIDTVVVFGASIMEQSFGGTGEGITEDLFTAQGATIAVHERATSGDNSTMMLANLPAIIAEFSGNAAKTLFAMHGGGNDVSFSGPYPGGDTLLESNMRAMLVLLKGAGFKIALSDITYRVPPASNPSDPYNHNVINPLIAEFAAIPLQFYALTFDNQGTWHSVDGIHPTTDGRRLTRIGLVDSVAPYIVVGPIPQPVAFEDVVIQFGLANVYPDGSNEIINSTPLTTVKNTDLSVVAGASIVMTGFESSSEVLGRGNVSNPSDTSISLTNNNGLLSYVFKTSGTISVDLSNAQLDPVALYTVGVTTSRDTVDANRDCDIVVASVTKVLNAAASPAEIVEFTSVLGSDLIATGITSTQSATFTYAYIGMIQITKE